MDFTQSYCQLMQIRYGENLKFVQQIDEKYYDKIKGGKVAVVADKDATYGTFRMYFSIAYERPQRVQVCRSLEEAVAFLGLPSTFLDQL